MRKILLTITILFLVSCATKTVMMQTSGGSKTDGTIILSYKYDNFTRVQPDFDNAQRKAEQACSRWGYSGAVRFGAGNRNCISRGNEYDVLPGTCITYRVDYTYQCID
tara:strand:+ start:1883 stop:2206 length:324 start_codon:yes stop_codon:yes gene_type:complete